METFGLDRFLERHGERVGETAWIAALAAIERAAHDAREGNGTRWRMYPRGDLRRLRRDIAASLELARIAVAIQEEMNEAERATMAEALKLRAVDPPRASTDAETRQRVRSRLATLAAKKRLGRRLEPWESPEQEDWVRADDRIAELARVRRSAV